MTRGPQTAGDVLANGLLSHRTSGTDRATIMKQSSQTPNCRLSGMSDVGRRRNSNQDHFLVADMRRWLKVCDSNLPELDRRSIVSQTPGYLLVVADGMGGHANGGYASRSAIRYLAAYIANLMDRFLVIPSGEVVNFMEELRKAPLHIHELFRADAERHPENASMGTTLTAAYVAWPWLYVVHVGDSRCYVQHAGQLQQLTTDHTVAQALMDASDDPNIKVKNRSLHHALWNSLSAGIRPPEPQLIRQLLEVGDRVMLCSDGLVRHLDAQQINTVLNSGMETEDKVSSLIHMTNQAGGRDNVSVVVADFEGVPQARELCHDDPQNYEVVNAYAEATAANHRPS